jgi:FAD/FMN-containing dehydrogenase
MNRRDVLRAAILTGAACVPAARSRSSELLSTRELPARTLSGSEISLSVSQLTDLASSLQGDVLLAGDPRYDRARRVWNGSIDKHPALIVECVGASDVVRAVNFAREHKLLTAVRAGGHSTSGKSTCDGGLMIDLAAMRGVRVDPHARTAYLAPGTLLGQLDRECAGFELATTLGTVSLTGAAGLTLGGGFGRLGSHFGLACDNLRAADVVTAGGQLVHVSETENADLLWGLRGGGGNFGVVTSLEYQLHSMKPIIVGGVFNWPLSEAPQVLDFYADFAPGKPDALCLDLLLRSAPGTDPGISLVVCWSGDPGSAERALQPVRTLARTAQGSVQPTRYVQLQSMFDRGFPDGRRYYQKSGLLTRLDRGCRETLLEVFRTPRPQPLAVQLQGLGGAANRVKPDATAFVHRDALWDMAFVTQWENPADSAANEAAIHAIWSRMEPFTKGFYVNSRSEDDQRAFADNYGDNYARLVGLKNKYDPANLFRLNANVAPTA